MEVREKIEMAKQEGASLYNALSSAGGLRKNYNFSKYVGKNKSLLRELSESLKESTKPTKKYQEYQEKQRALNEKYAQKNGAGQPIQAFGRYVIIPDKYSIFDAENQELLLEYKEEVDVYGKLLEDFEEELKEKITVDLYMIDEKDVPKDVDNTLTGNEWEYMVLIIKEEAAK